MDNLLKEGIIQQYIDGYNNFNIERMVARMDEKIVFLNIQGNETTMKIEGIDAFAEQARQATSYFSKRKQTILSIKHGEKETEVEIAYEAELAMDFPNGLKKGEKLFLNGKSIFMFKEGKIIQLTDIS